MVSSRSKNLLYDKMQRAWVTTCVGVTLVTTAVVGYQLFNYFVYIKPLKKEMEEQLKRDLLKEGMMKDNASVMTS